jgi:two-component system, cell cycle response regulator
MHSSRSFREIVSAMLSRPDEIMLEVGAGGELAVARLRVVIAALLLLLPLGHALAGGSVKETLIGLGGAIFINLFALAWLQLARRRRRYPWLPFATAAFDVSATTAVLAVLAINNLPAGLNSLIVWCGYVLAIMLTALRSDGRTTLFAGALAIVQFGALIAVVFALATSPEQLISSDYGAVTPSSQIQRLVLLAIITLITAMVVYRVQRLVELSGTDGLTRLPNRTWLLHRMPRLIDAAQEDGGSLTLALIDMDYFKRINDENGHHAGDRALRHVVGVLKSLAEPSEWLVRLGGEEFVLVLHKPVGSAWERVDAIRRLVATRPFEPERGHEPMLLTFSAGLASYPHDGHDLSLLLRRADQRLQIAKREGRNRVVAREA